MINTDRQRRPRLDGASAETRKKAKAEKNHAEKAAERIICNTVPRQPPTAQAGCSEDLVNGPDRPSPFPWSRRAYSGHNALWVVLVCGVYSTFWVKSRVLGLLGKPFV